MNEIVAAAGSKSRTYNDSPEMTSERGRRGSGCPKIRSGARKTAPELPIGVCRGLRCRDRPGAPSWRYECVA